MYKYTKIQGPRFRRNNIIARDQKSDFNSTSFQSSPKTSPETQGQIVGARESLNGRKNMARRKVKNGEKSPWGHCLTRPVPNGRRRSAFWLGRKTQKFSGTNQKSERRRPFGTGLVRHCPQGLFSLFFTFLRAIFFHPFRLCPHYLPLGLRGCTEKKTACSLQDPFAYNESKYNTQPSKFC